MRILVLNNGVEVFNGPVSQFLEDNDNDGWLSEECAKLETVDRIEFSEISGDWVIAKMYSMGELIEIGKEDIENLTCYVLGLQATIGEDKEIHPDYMDTICDALFELEVDPVVFFREMDEE